MLNVVFIILANKIPFTFSMSTVSVNKYYSVYTLKAVSSICLDIGCNGC